MLCALTLPTSVVYAMIALPIIFILILGVVAVLDAGRRARQYEELVRRRYADASRPSKQLPREVWR